MEENRFKVGVFIWYQRFIGGPKELGRIKSKSSEGYWFVVYHCNGEWYDYKNYTGARTHESQMRLADELNYNVKIEQI